MRSSRWIRTGVFSTLLMLLVVGLFSATQPVVTQAASLKVTRFYTNSRTSYDKWVAAHKDLPSPLQTFAAGTKDVGYILKYAGATPKVSRFQIIVYDGSGDVFESGVVHKLGYKNGTFADYFHYNPHFPDGTYTMKLLVNGKADGSTSFSVGS